MPLSRAMQHNDAESERAGQRATKATGARPTLDNRQKFPIIKRTGVYTGNQFRIRDASEEYAAHVRAWTIRRVRRRRWFLQKEICLSCSWCFLRRSTWDDSAR